MSQFTTKEMAGVKGWEKSKPIREKLANARGKAHTQFALGMRRGTGSGVSGLLGRGFGNVLGRGGIGGVLRGFEKFMARAVAWGSMLVVGAAVIGTSLAVLAVAFGGIIIVVASLAAYIIENWNKLSKDVRDNMAKIRVAMRGVVEMGLRLWYGLVGIGEQLTGAAAGSDVLIVALDTVKLVIDIISSSVVNLIDLVVFLKRATIGFSGSITRYKAIDAKILSYLPWKADEVKKRQAEVKKRLFDDSDEIEKLRGYQDLAERFRTMQTKGGLSVTDAKIDAITNKLTEMLGKAAGEKPNRKVPKAGVHVDNMHVNLDLRDTDPDRVMDAFIPQIERLADKRVQAYDMQEQGA